MPTTITLFKFVGTVSLGLLTGVSYTLSTQSLPTLLTLDTARPAAYTLSQTIRLAELHATSLSTISTLSLLSAYALSPPRVRHPYLLWTSLVATLSGLSLRLFQDRSLRQWAVKDEGEDVNGETVEKKTRDQQRVYFAQTGISALGFVMAVVGVWGDGA